MDHVRGSSLAWPESLDTLRPFVVTWWSGRTIEDMPKDIRKVYDDANFNGAHINLALVVLGENGKVLRATIPFIQPPAFQFDPAAQGRDFKAQLDRLLDGLTLPKVTKPTALSLPDVCGGRGLRVYLTFEANRLNHYRTPTIETIADTDEMRTALRFPSGTRQVEIKSLRPLLEQIYPPAIMDGKGAFERIDGKLTIASAGLDDTYSYAILSGYVDFYLDNASRSSYSGKLQLAIRYRGPKIEFHSLRGTLEAVVPKGPERIKMTAAIESRPD